MDEDDIDNDNDGTTTINDVNDNYDGQIIMMIIVMIKG